MRLRFKPLFLALVLVFVVANPGMCIIAQEPTQITVKLKAISEWLNTLEMKTNQLKMLAQLPSQVISQIQGMKDMMVENFSQVRDMLGQVESITHFTDDLEGMLKERHPEWESGLTIEGLKARNEQRDAQWKKTTEAYLKALNMTAKEFENDEKTRDKLLSALSSSEGQVQALQALGALLDHTNSILARNEQTVQGFMTTYLEAERDEIDKREQKEQSIKEAYQSLQNMQAPGKTFKPGFK